MKYVSIDIETTGLNPETCQILEFAAVIEDTSQNVPVEQLPNFRRILVSRFICGEPYALQMNSELLKEIASKTVVSENCCAPHMLGKHFAEFLSYNGIGDKFAAAGKNFANFDLRFLRQLDGFPVERIHHRILDPAMFFLETDDIVPPSSVEVMRRAGLQGEVAHRALDDARMVVKMMRVGFQNQSKGTQ